MSLTGEPPKDISTAQKIWTAVGVSGLGILVLATFNVHLPGRGFWLALSLILMCIGVIAFAKAEYKSKHEGIKNDGVMFKSLTSRGFWAYVLGIVLTGFYIILYFYPEYLGLRENENVGLIALFDPLSYLLSGNPASQWFVYGVLYTMAILLFGIKFLWKYRHNRYERIRTFSVMFFQLGFAFLIPELMMRLNANGQSLPYYDLKNIWPLNYYNFHEYRVDAWLDAGTIGLFFLGFGILSILVITPILTYKYGKRWYCSWVCGCGGLAETAGDPFRHLSDKSLMAWKIERWVVHSVLVFVVVMTTAVVHSYLNSGEYWIKGWHFLLAVGGFLTVLFGLIWIFRREELEKDARYGAIGYLVIVLAFIALYFTSGGGQVFALPAETLRSTYGFLIGAVFSGVIGVGFYPIWGSRVWCRFGCPMAAILGLQQRLFSKFRITTNGGQCISCGNCSTYCEMGIDVRAYAQKGENIVRASCVGCGICSAVCPRGVLNLENGPLEGRIDGKAVLHGQDPDLMELLNKQK